MWSKSARRQLGGRPQRSPLPLAGRGRGRGSAMPRSVIEPRIRERAKELRRKKTLGEKSMQEYLRAFRPLGARFRRETPIGSYVVDFAWLSARIVIEVDGATHDEPGAAARDAEKDRFLRSRGFKVIRVRDGDAIANAPHAYAPIEKAIHLHLSYPSPSPSPQGGGEPVARSRRSRPASPRRPVQ
jgi:very-short-patch-repair endonuclease